MNTSLGMVKREDLEKFRKTVKEYVETSRRPTTSDIEVVELEQSGNSGITYLLIVSRYSQYNELKNLLFDRRVCFKEII